MSIISKATKAAWQKRNADAMQQLFQSRAAEASAAAQSSSGFENNLESNIESHAEKTRLFREAVKGTRPLKPARVHHQPLRPKPIPHQLIRDERQALKDSLSDAYMPGYALESGEELLYLRDGHAPDILSKLRRGHWVVQAKIDLHGLIADEARLYVAEFISNCKKRGIRCVRIIHGKGLGSKNGEPVLKNKLRGWLMQKDEVIAYAQARPNDGGSGAVIVLLKA